MRVSVQPYMGVQRVVRGYSRLGVQRFDMLWLAAGTLLVTAIAFIFGLWGSGGHLAPPLDDTFIHFQYARQLAAGHPFQYNTGDPASSGESAFLYPFLLVPAYLLGLNGQKTLIYADFLNLAAHIGAVLLLYKLAFRLGGRPLAVVSALLLLLDGRLNYIFASGMETGLYTFGLIAFFWLWLRDGEYGRLVWLAVVGAFVALLRPEGHGLVTLACLLMLAYLWRRHGGFRTAYLWLLVPILAGLIPYIVNLATTGQVQFNTAASKSIWYVPYQPFYQNISLTVGWAINTVKDTFLGLEIGRSPFPLLALPIIVLGMGAALGGMRHRFFHALLVAVGVAGVLLALLLPPIQFNRYYMPYDWIFLLYLAVGIVLLARLASRATAVLRRDGSDGSDGSLAGRVDGRAHLGWPMVCATVAAVVLLLPQFVSYFFALGDSTRDIYYQQMTFSDWIKQNTPPDARIGVNDTGAHKYMSDRYIIDLIGLTNNQLRGAYFGGWGSVYDTLMQMPEKDRPTYLLIHPNVFLNGIDTSIAQNFLTPVYSLRVQNVIITAGEVETLYKVNWEETLLAGGSTYLLHKGQTPLDSLNVGDISDEHHHSYNTVARQPSFAEPKSVLTTAAYEKKGFSLTESGRMHSGYEEFTLASQPGKSLTLVARWKLNPDADQQLLVFANGRQVGVWKVHNDRGGSWQEYEYTIPAEFVTGGQTRVRIDASFDPGGPGFTSYRYWAFAP